MRIALWVFPSKRGKLREGNSEKTKTTTKATHAGVSESLEPRFCSVTLLRKRQWYTSTDVFAMFVEVLRSMEVPLVAG